MVLWLISRLKMIELTYCCKDYRGGCHYRKGKFLSYKHAYNLLAYWNSFINGGWLYYPCDIPDEFQVEEINFINYRVHLS